MLNTKMLLGLGVLGLVACQLGAETETANSSTSVLSSSSSAHLSQASSSSLVLSSSTISLSSVAGSAAVSSSSFSSSSMAQTLPIELHCTESKLTATAVGKSTVHCLATNKGSSDLSMIVYRKNMVLTEGWSSSFCFGPQCYADFTDTSDVTTLRANDSLVVPVYVNVSTKGSATMTMVLESVNAPKIAKEASIEVNF